MIASENEEYIKHATFLATQAKEPVRHYEHKEIGYNYRMSNITAGVGRGQLLHLDEHIAKKKQSMRHTKMLSRIINKCI